MMTRRGDIPTGQASLFLILTFTFHVIIGACLLVAGAVVAIDLGELISSVGLFGAAAFALFNGIEGFIEFFKSITGRRYRLRA